MKRPARAWRVEFSESRTDVPNGWLEIYDQSGRQICQLRGAPTNEMFEDARCIAALPEIIEALEIARDSGRLGKGHQDIVDHALRLAGL